MPAVLALLVGLCVAAVMGLTNPGASTAAPVPDPAFDHQTAIYRSHFDPFTLTNTNISLTPFFSPDHSVDSQTWMIGNATRYVNIAAPGWDSWAYCSYVGCTPAQQRTEDNFPVWQALLNALHRGLTVRILTNDYGNSSYPPNGTIDPLTFLYLNGGEIRYFTTLTFLHTKYIETEATASVSSVNFDYTSYMENREAGLMISGEGATPLRMFMAEVFDYDWAIALPFVPNQNYSSQAMEIITNPAPIEIVIPERRNISAYRSPLDTVWQSEPVTVFASPDFAYENVLAALVAMQQSLQLMVYQVTNDDMCDCLLKFGATQGIDVTLLVSQSIFSAADCASAGHCYARLQAAGFKVRLTSEVFKFSHQKFWIIDGSVLFVSTGNWDTTDYPNGSNVFPPYNQSNWRSENRDFTLQIANAEVIGIFNDLFWADYAIGSDWNATSNPLTCTPMAAQPRGDGQYSSVGRRHRKPGVLETSIARADPRGG